MNQSHFLCVHDNVKTLVRKTIVVKFGLTWFNCFNIESKYLPIIQECYKLKVVFIHYLRVLRMELRILPKQNINSAIEIFLQLFKTHIQLNLFHSLQLSVKFSITIEFHICLLSAPFSWNICIIVLWWYFE